MAPFPMSIMNLLRVCAMSIAVAMAAAPAAQAHEIRPTIADVDVGAEAVTITLRITLETLLAGIDLTSVQDTNDAPEAAIYDSLRAMSADQLEAMLRADWPRIAQGFLIDVEGMALTAEIAAVSIPAPGDLELPRDSTLTIIAALPPGEAGVSLGLAPGFGSFVPRQMGGGVDAYEGFLNGGEMTPPLPRMGILTESGMSVFLRYIVVGFEHILPLGLDHILFVLGLYFFATKVGPLLWQVSAFTLAHTITLALAATGVVKIPASIVEPLIAASIVYVGVENIIGRRNLKGRTALVFGLGLLHGLGFASVLGDYGIASGRFVQALIGFNIGVEIGQLTVIAMAFAATGWAITRGWYRPVVAIPASLVIAAIGAYWVVERTLL
ncbi:HupE/UreJ family protein [Roseicyclus sp.]|uniref:HupE/UreJ family protein n=1 Tax=Roseicyclus sp. TaxID=1914329 RepID=UPI003F6AE4E3